MKSNLITVCAIILLACQTITSAQKTEVSVRRGKVVAETGAAGVAVDAGRKAILTPDKQPWVTVDDPMVDEVMEICKWAEQESQAQRQVIEGISVLNIKMEGEDLFTMAYFAEMRNENSEPSTICPLSLSSVYEEPRFYDLQGNLLRFDLEKVDVERGYYTLHFSSPVEQGGSFKYILVSRSPRGLSAWKDGVLWQLRPNVGDPNRISYCRLILPKSGIFVDSNRQAVSIDSVDGRVAVTCRAYTGPLGDNTFHFAFLWPEKDGTTLADVPAQYRGLREETPPEIVEKGLREAAGIQAGNKYQDQSTPLDTLLTIASALAHKDSEVLLGLVEPGLRQFATTQVSDETIGRLANYRDELDVLTLPQWPAKPENGQTYSLDVCRKGSLLREVTLNMVYQEGKWYLAGLTPVVEKADSEKDDAAATTGEDKPAPPGLRMEKSGGEPSEAAHQDIQPGQFIRKWLFLGPISIPWNGPDFFPDAETQKKTFGSDPLDLDQWKPSVTIDGRQYRWALLQSEYGIVDLTQLFQDWFLVAYVWTEINMTEETRAVLGIGSDDSVKVWLNGELVHEHWEENGRGAVPDNDRVPVTFKKGKNQLVLKIQNGGGPWGFCCRRLEAEAPAK